MKKYQYSVKVKVNAAGFVAQKGESVVGEKIYTKEGYFSNLTVLQQTLKRWTNNLYLYYTSVQDDRINSVKQHVNYRYADGYATPHGEIAWHGPQGHDYDYIIVSGDV